MKRPFFKPTRVDGLILVALLIGSPAYAQGDPILDNLARQIKACANFAENVLAGQTLDIKLALPPALNGTGQCGTGSQMRIFGAATRSAPGGSRVTAAGIVAATERATSLELVTSPEPATAPGVRSGVVEAAPGFVTMHTLVGGVDVPCELLPGGCPAPIDPGGGGTTGPQTQIQITSVNVKWEVKDGITSLVAAKDYSIPSGAALDAAIVMAPIRFVELTPQDPTSSLVKIVATVTVNADKTILGVPPSTSKISSAPVPIEIPLALAALQVPKVFVLFMTDNFRDAAAVYLPASSALNKTTLPATVRRLAGTYNGAVSKLEFVTWFASYMAGLSALNDVFVMPRWDLKELKDAESNLNNDDFIHRSAYTSVNDTEVEDESEALLLLGLQGTKVVFFQNRGFKGMRFTAEVGPELAVIVRDFAKMSSEPPGAIIDKTYTASKTPNNSLSSFKWQ